MSYNRSLQFSISTLLLLTTGVGVYLAVSTYPERRRQAVIRVYDAQKDVVKAAADQLERELKRDGYAVEKFVGGLGGSGEWRSAVIITARNPELPELICYVEVMGFVSHDASDSPTWMDNLPMKISKEGKNLDDRFIKVLTEELDTRKWEYIIDTKCRNSYADRG